MGGIVTALKFQKGNKERVNVYLDGTYAFGLSAVIAATRLRRGQVLSDVEIAELQTQDERDRAYDQAIRFLRYRPRSRAEMEQYLRGKHFSEDAVNNAMARLEQAGYLDDETFARFWVENRQRFRPRSRRALSVELRRKGLEHELVRDVVSEQNDEEAAWQAVEPQLSRWRALGKEELRRKLTDFLARRGFDYETIRVVYHRVCQALHTNNEE